MRSARGGGGGREERGREGKKKKRFHLSEMQVGVAQCMYSTMLASLTAEELLRSSSWRLSSGDVFCVCDGAMMDGWMDRSWIAPIHGKGREGCMSSYAVGGQGSGGSQHWELGPGSKPDGWEAIW